VDRSRVAVLYAHPLFGKGIAKLLARDQRLEVSCEPASEQDVVELARVLLPDALVLEGSNDPVLLSLLIQNLPPIPVTFVDLRENTLTAYRERQPVVPPPATILDAVLPASP
jgi:hypothetical protein